MGTESKAKSLGNMLSQAAMICRITQATVLVIVFQKKHLFPKQKRLSALHPRDVHELTVYEHPDPLLCRKT